MIREEDGGAEGGGAGGGGDEGAGTGILGGDTKIEAKEEPTGIVEEGWLKGVQNEWAQDSSMQNITSIEDLAKSYVHAQRMVGKDKVVLPNEHSTDEERREFLHKMGLPKTAEDYGVKPGEETRLSEDFAKSFIEKAYEKGIMPNQAQDMMNWYEEQLGAEETLHNQAAEQSLQETVDTLKSEYGQAYDSKINLANKVLQDNMDEDTIESMRASGLLSNKEFIQTMVKIGEGLVKEGSFNHEPKADGRLTPSEAKRKIGEIQANQDHAYHNKSHPNHQIAVKEVTELFEYVG